MQMAAGLGFGKKERFDHFGEYKTQVPMLEQGMKALKKRWADWQRMNAQGKARKSDEFFNTLFYEQVMWLIVSFKDQS